jgi:hypothetical protein
LSAAPQAAKAAPASTEMAALAARVAAAGDLDRKAEVLLTGLAGAIKGVSNDQNVQRLSRELRAAVPGLVEALRVATDR